MIRFLFRFLSAIALSVAVIAAVMDATRSIAISTFDPTPLGAHWFRYAPDSLVAVQASLEAVWPWLWDPAMLTLLKIPGFVAFAIIAFVFYAVGHRPQRVGALAVGT